MGFFGSESGSLTPQDWSGGIRSLGGGLGGLMNKGAARNMPDMDRDRTPTPHVPAAGQGFYQPADQSGKAALLQAMIARSRAGHGA